MDYIMTFSHKSISCFDHIYPSVLLNYPPSYSIAFLNNLASTFMSPFKILQI